MAPEKAVEPFCKTFPLGTFPKQLDQISDKPWWANKAEAWLSGPEAGLPVALLNKWATSPEKRINAKYKNIKTEPAAILAAGINLSWQC